MSPDDDLKEKPDSYWKEKLTPEQYRVCRLGGTERPFGDEYQLFKSQGHGTYFCAACSFPLFSSETKYDSGSGWPSFWDVLEHGNVERVEDRSHGMVRVEVRCQKCSAHLGHVFPDGPPPTRLRYCINMAALKFR